MIRAFRVPVRARHHGGRRLTGHRAAAVAVAAAAMMVVTAPVAGASPALHRPALMRSSMTARVPAPTLGEQWARSMRGIGTVRPSVVFLGGDPTGLVRRIHWRSWGGARVTGSGRAVDDSSGVPVVRAPVRNATVVAFDLGVCNGRRMYQGLEWYFPGVGQRFDPRQFINICSGDRPGRGVGSLVGGVYPQPSYPACTVRTLAAGLSRGTVPVHGRIDRPHGCYGSFAYSAVVVHGSDIPVLFLAHGQHWGTVRRARYCPLAVPQPIYQPACNAS